MHIWNGSDEYCWRYRADTIILDPKSKEDKVKVTNLKNSPKFQIFEFRNKHYARHTFWSCLIRFANMKWIRWVLLKIQSGHDSVHRRTDGQTDKVKPALPPSPFNFVEAEGINRRRIAGIGIPIIILSLRFIKGIPIPMRRRFLSA